MDKQEKTFQMSADVPVKDFSEVGSIDSVFIDNLHIKMKHWNKSSVGSFPHHGPTVQVSTVNPAKANLQYKLFH